MAFVTPSAAPARAFEGGTPIMCIIFVQAQALKQQESHAHLKAYIDDEIRAVHERISAQIRDSQLGLKACVDSLGRNIQDLKDAMR